MERVQAERETNGSHFQRVAGGGSRAEQDAVVLAASRDEQSGVETVSPFALLALVKDDERTIRQVPGVAATEAAALAHPACPDFLVVGDEQGSHAKARRHRFPARDGGLGRNNHHGQTELGGHGTGNIGLACTGVACVKRSAVFLDGRHEVGCVVLLVGE